MLTALYSFLLRRRSAAFPHEIAREMLADFQEAREDARSNGLVAYLGFGMRELAGIAWPAKGAALHTHRPRKLRWVATFGVAGAVIAGVVAYSVPERYTSTATISLSDTTIPERYFAPGSQPDWRRLLAKQTQTVLSRNSLRNIIRVYGLYDAELSRKPLEDVIEEMRQEVTVSAGMNNTVKIAFTYSDPQKAQKVARDLMTRIIDANIRERAEEIKTLTMFLEGRAEAAAKDWMAAMAATKGLQQGSPEWHKASLDLDLARQEYQSARTKVMQAKTGEAAASWKYGMTLEVVDLPALPQQERFNRPLIVAAGVVAGMLVGLLLSWLRSVRPVDPMLSAPTSA